MTDEMRTIAEERGDIVCVNCEVFGCGVGAVSKAASIHEAKVEVLGKRLLRLPGHLRAEHVTMDQDDGFPVALIEHLDRCSHIALQLSRTDTDPRRIPLGAHILPAVGLLCHRTA